MTVEDKFQEYFKTFPKYGTYLAENWKKEIVRISKEYTTQKCQELLEIVAEKVDNRLTDFEIEKVSILNAVDLNNFIK